MGVTRAVAPAAAPGEQEQLATPAPAPAANASVARQNELQRLLHSGSTRPTKPVLPRLPEPAPAAPRPPDPAIASPTPGVRTQPVSLPPPRRDVPAPLSTQPVSAASPRQTASTREPLTAADVYRNHLLAAALDSGGAQGAPSAIPLTRAQAQARLHDFVRPGARADIARDNGQDYLQVTDAAGTVVQRARLTGASASPPQSSPVARIDAIAASAPQDRPLLGMRIALDPGHAGGIEDREHNQKFSGGLVEGDLTLSAAQRLRQRLERLGATVMMTRDSDIARTGARAELTRLLSDPAVPTAERDRMLARLDPDSQRVIRARLSANQPYSSGEIDQLLNCMDLEQRAQRISAFRPDLVLSLHFDAEKHDLDPNARRDVAAFIPGAYMAGELESSVQRASFFRQIGSTAHGTSAQLAASIVAAVAPVTGSEPLTLSEHGRATHATMGEMSPGVFTRNLRLLAEVKGDPVAILLEGATYNNPDIHAQITRDRAAFFDQYTGGIERGLLAFMNARRGAVATTARAGASEG